MEAGCPSIAFRLSQPPWQDDGFGLIVAFKPIFNLHHGKMIGHGWVETRTHARPENSLKRTFRGACIISLLGSQEAGGGEQQLGQINSNLNPISGRPITIGGNNHRAPGVLRHGTRVQVATYMLYKQVDPGKPFAQGVPCTVQSWSQHAICVRCTVQRPAANSSSGAAVKWRPRPNWRQNVIIPWFIAIEPAPGQFHLKGEHLSPSVTGN